MCMQDANYGLGLLSLGQNGGLLHSHQNLATICQGIKIKTFCVKEANFAKEWT